MSRFVLVVTVVVFAVGCSSGNTTSGSTKPEPSPATDALSLTALGPLAAEVGSVPRFEWNSIEGANSYRLVVLGPDGPIWVWEGSETSVNLGGLATDRPELMPGPVVVAGTSWSVAAFDASGSVIGLVGPIGIGGEAVAGTEPPRSTTTTLVGLTASDLPDPCTLITQEDVDAIFGKAVDPGEPQDAAGSGGTVSGKACNWGSISTLGARIHISPSYVTPMRICDYCEPVTGYGDEAWGGITDRGSGGGIFVVIVDGLGIQVEAYGPDVTLEQLGALADDLLAGLP